MKRLVAQVLPILGVAVLWRTAQWYSPSIGMAVVGILLLAALVAFYVKQPAMRPTWKWAWLVPFGAGLNFVAIIANGGTMPIPQVMSPTWWIWLGDWLPGALSPGDITMLIGFVGVIVTIIRDRSSPIEETAQAGLAEETPRKPALPERVQR